eukprot:3603760-Rhodomonas_salina.5
MSVECVRILLEESRPNSAPTHPYTHWTASYSQKDPSNETLLFPPPQAGFQGGGALCTFW